ncbi:MAG: hypothetical protein WAL29_07725 [Bacteroidales bacterium]
MNDDPTLIESLFKRVTEFSLTSIELLKLKTISRLTTVVSTVFPDIIVSTLILIFLLFVNLGLAYWLGDVFGRMYLGFLTVAAFYLLLGLVSHIFMRGWLKKVAADYFIKRIFS